MKIKIKYPSITKAEIEETRENLSMVSKTFRDNARKGLPRSDEKEILVLKKILCIVSRTLLVAIVLLVPIILIEYHLKDNRLLPAIVSNAFIALGCMTVLAYLVIHLLTWIGDQIEAKSPLINTAKEIDGKIADLKPISSCLELARDLQNIDENTTINIKISVEPEKNISLVHLSAKGNVVDINSCVQVKRSGLSKDYYLRRSDCERTFASDCIDFSWLGNGVKEQLNNINNLSFLDTSYDNNDNFLDDNKSVDVSYRLVSIE